MRSLCVTIVALILTTEAAKNTSCHKEFQCTFENKNFHLPIKSGGYVWGGDVIPLKFKTKDELIWIQQRLDEFRSEFYGKVIFSNFMAYMTTYMEMHRFLNATDINNKDKITSFAAVYEPAISNELVKSDFQNSLTLLVKFLRHLELNFDSHCLTAAYDLKLSKKEQARIRDLLSNIEKHYFIAIGGTTLDVERIINSQVEFPIDLEKEYLVGVIKFSVNGTLGYLIIDAEHPHEITPVVMNNDNDHSRMTLGERFLEDDNEPSSMYKLIGKNRNFIQVKRSDVIFVGRPLCSLLATHNRILLLTDTLSLLNFNPKFHPTVTLGHVYAKLHPERRSERFRLGFHEVKDRHLNLEEITFESLSDVKTKEEKEVFYKTQKVFRLQKGVLEWRISTLQKFLNQYLP